MNYSRRMSAIPNLVARCAIVAFVATQAIAAQPASPERQPKIGASLSTHQEIVLVVNHTLGPIKEFDAPAYGDWLLGIREAPPSRRDRRFGEVSLSPADGRLSQLPDRDRKVLKSRIRVLRRFNAVIVAISADQSTTSQPDVSKLNYAAANLAEYLDDPNAALAESARLWQAAAYWRAGNSERALKTLRPIVSDPVHPRIGFVSRLFRVRLLALSGQPVAALADCNRIAARIDRWFSDYSEKTRESARSAVREMQIAIYESWNARLTEASDEHGKKAVAERLAELKKDTPEPEADKRFKLKSLIGGLPPLKLPESESPASTQPAN